MTPEQQQQRIHELADKLAKDLVKAGKLIEGGWYGYRALCVPHEASDVQVFETRMAFFAGAQHLWGSIMGIMDADREPTQADMDRMDAIDHEIRTFAESVKAEVARRMAPPSH
jgi:hypothetical protein